MTIPLFLIPVVSGLLAQAFKTFFSKSQRNAQARTLDPRPHYGGMPSAHTAFASSLVLVAAKTEGISSAAFAIAFAFFMLVLDDALRLRIFLGRYGRAIHKLASRLPQRERRTFPPIEYRMGHTMPEVIGGVIVGVLVSFGLFFLDRLARGTLTW